MWSLSGTLTRRHGSGSSAVQTCLQDKHSKASTLLMMLVNSSHLEFGRAQDGHGAPAGRCIEAIEQDGTTVRLAGTCTVLNTRIFQLTGWQQGETLWVQRHSPTRVRP